MRKSVHLVGHSFKLWLDVFEISGRLFILYNVTGGTSVLFPWPVKQKMETVA